jgi:signal transduction histidine kinase
VLVEATFKVFPRPEARATLRRSTNGIETAVALVRQLTRSTWDLEAIDIVVDAGAPADDVPRVAIGPPFERLALTPDRAKWTEALAHYRRRVFIVVGEGVLFVVAMVTAVALLWAVLRREGERERQHQNFVSAVTHELKTPIAGIRLALETVLSGRVDDQGRERFLRNAVADADRLSDLVQKVLEATRYAGGAHRLEIALGDLSQLVEEEVMAGERRAAALGVRLAADVRPDIQAPFDPEALGIVLSNLLENAFKYATGSPVSRGPCPSGLHDCGKRLAVVRC